MALDASKLKAGDFLSRISYMRVISVDGDSVEVENEAGFRWSIARSILEAEAVSSNQFKETKKVTRTELARVMEQDIRDSVFSVAFTKMPDAASQEKTLAEADLSTPAKRRRVAKELGVGKERVLHGHLDDTHDLGRVSAYSRLHTRCRLMFIKSFSPLAFIRRRCRSLTSL